MRETQLQLGPPEVLWLDSSEFEHWTGRSAGWVLRDAYPAGLTVYERNNRKFIIHSEYIAFLKSTSTRKELIPHGQSKRPEEDNSPRFTRDDRGRVAAVAGWRR